MHSRGAFLGKYRMNPGSGLEIGIYTLDGHIADPYTGERISS